jgi:hypothetical protein
MGKAQRFQQWKTPRQAGERARLKIVHGPDSGSLFVLTADKATLGRGDENDIVFADLRASRRHAEISRHPSGVWKLRDLGSQNGVVHNGKVTRETDLRGGDVVTVGETAFEFVPEEAATQVLHSGPKALSPDLLLGRPSLPAARPAQASAPAPAHVPRAPADLSGLQGIAGLGAATGSAGGGSEKRKKVLMAIVVVMGAVLFLDDSDKKPAPSADRNPASKKEKKEPLRDLAQYLPALPGNAPQASSETFFKEGFREFREKNYLRARVQFENALQINPGHSLAANYLKQCDTAIETEVNSHINRGRRDADAGKLKSARAHFEAVLRLLARDPEDPNFLEAKDQLKDVELRMRGGAES